MSPSAGIAQKFALFFSLSRHRFHSFSLSGEGGQGGRVGGGIVGVDPTFSGFVPSPSSFLLLLGRHFLDESETAIG